MLAALCPAHQAREPLFIANPSDFANPSERCGNPRDGDNNIIEAMNLENTKVKKEPRKATPFDRYRVSFRP
jgi:hypothetical protein